MHFEIEKKDFMKGLGLTQSVAERKTALPILSHILLGWDKDSLYLIWRKGSLNRPSFDQKSGRKDDERNVF